MTALRLAFLAFLLAAGPALADEFSAHSTTASAITGDISFDDYEMVFANGEKIEFEDLVDDHFSVDGKRVPASVYSVRAPGNPELLNGNRLCGESGVTYLASWLEDDVTMVAVFETPEPPQDSSEMCALYTYVYP